ncbi:MAG: GNAT family N-acetyltransferase [Eubacterium sp.]|nr:GNAT family N-acetyltransferase [Eubacterium sp.]
MSEIKFYDTLPEEAKNIRITVFVEEQGFQNELDEIDNSAVHALLFKDGQAVATARMYEKDNGKAYYFGRIAVLKEYRGQNLGYEIVDAMLKKAKALGAEKCEISAQCRAMGFYQKLGFKEEGETYLDEHCPHIHMERIL